MAAGFRASNILSMSACLSFILSYDDRVRPAFKLNGEVFCFLLKVKSLERVNFVKSIFLLLETTDERIEFNFTYFK